MKKSLLLLSFCFIVFTISSQVIFVIDSLPDYTPPEDILYIAGDFQGWNPGDPAYALQKNEDEKWFIVLDSMAPETTIAFKFTRGDWGKVEKGEFGEEIPDRQFTFGNGETISIKIFNWADAGGAGGTTAAENVAIMDEEFYMPQLDRSRRIWVYLPPDYEESEDNYPVIYMHDGQNLFDTYTAFAGEWEVDETLNELYDEGYFVPIVIGIDNGGTERVNEYTPWVNSQYGGGLGSDYIDFIVETLKPYIDENYRTLPGRESTAIWGSSLGGLISHYGALKFQDVFSKAGIYSPSYWWSEEVWSFTEDMGHQFDMKLYQMTGSLEGGDMVQNTLLMDELLLNIGFGEEEVSTSIFEGGEHNELLWRTDFEEAYLWLFHSFANDIPESEFVQTILISPNPVHSYIEVPVEAGDKIEGVFIYDIQGKCVYNNISGISDQIVVSELVTGIYMIQIFTREKVYQSKFVKE